MTWDDFEGALLALVRKHVAAGQWGPNLLAAWVARCMLGAPAGIAADRDAIAKAIDRAMGRKKWRDARGLIVNDDAILIEILVAAMRAAGVESSVRKDPFRYEKDKLGARNSHKRKTGKRD